MKELLENIRKNTDVRKNLIDIKAALSDSRKQETLSDEDCDALMRLLAHEDPKVRKNAALILGLVKCDAAAEHIVDAYDCEDTLFVKADYVKALVTLKCDGYLDKFHERLEELEAMEPALEEKKHVEAEIKAINELLLKKEGINRHKFNGYDNEQEIILLTNPAFREVTIENIKEGEPEDSFSVLKTVGAGVRVKTANIEKLLAIRTYDELLFDMGAPEATVNVDRILSWIKDNHSGEAPYYFRISAMGKNMKSMDRDKQISLIRNLSAEIESRSGKALKNSPSDYEFEFKLILGDDNKKRIFIKDMTLSDNRFSYRKEHIAAGLRPYIAAGILALSKPYLYEYPQVLDPFCGVGTLLIERKYISPVRSCYGIDTFGEAIKKARKNTETANMQVNYINRDFFDFRHDYQFNEVICDMPVLAPGTDSDSFYKRFFEKADVMMSPKGRVFCYCNEMGLVKKYIRLSKSFRLIKEFCINERTGFYLFIIEKNEKVRA